MDKEVIGRIIFKDGHTEDIIDYYEVVEDEWLEVWTKNLNKYVYKKTFEHHAESGYIIPRHNFYKRRLDKYENPDYILCNDIKQFEFFNTYKGEHI